MVCYIIPTAAAIAVYGLRKNKREWKKNVHYYWLNLLLLGSAIFGVVDHLWNGELFLISETPLIDLALGITITIATFIAWKLIVVSDKTKATEQVIH